MSYKTMEALISDVQNRIGLVTGSGFQTYSEPQIRIAVQDAFNFMFRKRFWKHLSDWYTYTLDGTTGLLTSAINTIVAAPEDAKDFFVADTGQLIVEPVSNEHLVNLSSSSPLYRTWLPWTHASAATKMIKFWPITATGDVTFYARTHPGTFDDVDTVPLSDDVLGWCATWLILESDGLNPAAANKARLMYEVSYKDYIASQGDDVIGHKRGKGNVFVTLS